MIEDFDAMNGFQKDKSKAFLTPYPAEINIEKTRINNNHYYWLDFMRFFSALMVLIVHARSTAFVEYGALPVGQKTITTAIFYALTRVGNEAVIVFFVLSGFLVGGKSIEKMIKKKFNPKSYIIDRFFRIYVPLIPALILTAIVGKFVGESFNLIEFLGNILNLQGVFVVPFGGNGPLWSLSYEVWFYVLILFCAKINRNTNVKLLDYIFFAVTILVFTKLNTVYLFCLIVGLFSYLRRIELSYSCLICVLILMIYSICGIQIGYSSISLSTNNMAILFPSLDASRVIFASCVGLIMQNVVSKSPKFKASIFIEKLGCKLSVFSYSLYLVHYPCIKLIKYFGLTKSGNMELEAFFNFVNIVIICLIFSLFFYIVFEKNTQVAKNIYNNKIYYNKTIQV